jgi:hypothetical protein
MSYNDKYLKYKEKYLELKKQLEEDKWIYVYNKLTQSEELVAEKYGIDMLSSTDIKDGMYTFLSAAYPNLLFLYKIENIDNIEKHSLMYKLN